MTWAELEEKVVLLRNFLERMPGLRRGDRLGVLGHNSAEYLQVRNAQQKRATLVLLWSAYRRDCIWMQQQCRKQEVCH